MLTQQKLRLWSKLRVSDSPVRGSEPQVGSVAQDQWAGTTHCSWQSPGLPNCAAAQAGVFMVKPAQPQQMNHCQQAPEQAHWQLSPLPAAWLLQGAAVQAVTHFHFFPPLERNPAHGKTQHPAREKRVWTLGLHREKVSGFTSALVELLQLVDKTPEDSRSARASAAPQSISKFHFK